MPATAAPPRSVSDRGLLVLRAGFVLLLVTFHGWTRFLSAFDYAVLGEPWAFVALVEQLGIPWAPVFAVLSALSESLGALLVGVGLLTRSAALLIVVNFTVALVNEASGGQPIELAALYLLCALVTAICGPGAYSIDRVRSDRSKVLLPSIGIAAMAGPERSAMWVA